MKDRIIGTSSLLEDWTLAKIILILISNASTIKLPQILFWKRRNVIVLKMAQACALINLRHILLKSSVTMNLKRSCENFWF